MERLPVRYAAIACVVGGVMLTGGVGAVARADDPSGDGGDPGPTNVTGPETPAATAPVNTFHLPKWLRLPGFGSPAPRKPLFGPITPPVMNLPPWLGTNPTGTDPGQPGSVLSAFSLPQWVAVTVPQDNPDGQPPGQQPMATMVADSGPQSSDPSGAPDEKTSPTISFVPLNASGVPTGPSITIKNPLPDLDQLPIDLHKPIVPQLLPPPLLLLLMTISDRFPLAGLIIAPVLNAKLPPFIADVVIPALLSDIVIPTLPIGGVVPATTPDMTSPSNPDLLSLKPSGPLPAELALTGMDVLQAPEPQPGLPPLFEPPKPPKPIDENANALSDAVSFRAGYSDYLRNAGMAQITAIAVPGAAAILLFTLGGGFIGYRQARAGHVIRAEGISRFLR